MTSSVWAALRLMLAVACTVTFVVAPFSIAVSDSQFDMAASVGMAAAVGLLVGVSGGRGIHAWLGAMTAFVVGIGAALATGLIPGRGMFVLLPPVHALACGFLWGSRPELVRTTWQAVRLCLGVGLFLGIGIWWAERWFGFLSAVGISVGGLTYIEGMRLLQARRLGDPVRFAGLMIAGILSAAILWMGVGRAIQEMPGMSMSLTWFGGVMMLLVIPAGICHAFRGFARWLAPRAALLRTLGEYVRALSLPIGAFALGYMVIVITFAGAYGVTFRIDGDAFQLASEINDPGIGTWLFMAFVVATSQAFVDVIPVSGMAKLLVGVQMLLCLGWALVVFAAVMAHAGPVLQKIAERRSDETGEATAS